MEYYQGSLRQFAEELLAKGRGNGMMVEVAPVNELVIEDAMKKGLLFHSMTIVVTQNTIFKYANHPKEKKGAVVPVSKYDLIEKALKTPLHIYEDPIQNEIIYVFTCPYDESKLIKVVVHPNYKLKRGVFINSAKSWGIVVSEAFYNSQYRMIK